MRVIYIALLLISLSSTAAACDVTISPGTNVVSSAVAVANIDEVICLNLVSYTQTETVYMKAGQRLMGVGSKSGVKIDFSSGIRGIALGPDSRVDHLSIGAPKTPVEVYGLIAYADPNVRIWEVDVEGFKIGIGINLSDNARITAVTVSGTGFADSTPSPATWVKDSSDARILYGQVTGDGNGPSSDGEVLCDGSDGFELDSMHLNDSGASAIYIDDCDNAVVKNNTVMRASEWGIDIVNGSQNATVTGNDVKWSYFGGSVFQEITNGSGAYTNNIFQNNNTSGVGNCSGININGNLSNVAMTGNSVSPSPTSCTYI